MNINPYKSILISSVRFGIWLGSVGFARILIGKPAPPYWQAWMLYKIYFECSLLLSCSEPPGVLAPKQHVAQFSNIQC